MKIKLLLLLTALSASPASWAYCSSGTAADVCHAELSNGITDVESNLSKEITNREDGDKEVLSSANTFTEDKVSTEKSERNKANTAERSARLQADTAETSARIQADTAERSTRIEGDANTLSAANTYTKDKFGALNHKLDHMGKRLDAAIAGTTAIASIPYLQNQDVSFGIGGGNYRGGNAIAFGSQFKTSENSNLRANIAWDSQGNLTSGAGFSMGW